MLDYPWWSVVVQTIFRRPDIGRVMQLLEDGERLRLVARILYLPPSAVDWLWKSCQEIGVSTRRQGQGRSWMTTQMQERFLVLLSRRNHKSAAKALEIDFCRAAEVHLLDQIVRNELHCDDTRARRHAQGPVLTAQHRAERFKFARQHHNWQIHHWRPILFTDETSFTESTNDRRARLWRPQENDTQTVTLSLLTGTMGAHNGLDRDTLGWSYRTVCGIMAARHRYTILKPIVRPHTGAIGDAFILMQYNARAHTAQVSMTFIDDTGISVMNCQPGLQTSTQQNIHGAFFLDLFDNGRIIHIMYRTMSMPWFRNCRPHHKRASGVWQVVVRSVWTIREVRQVMCERMC